jgi:hypothetical protein
MKKWILLLVGFMAIERFARADEMPDAVQMPTVIVTGTNIEETLFGPNEQPEWTAHRRFTNARVYVLPPWQINTEFSWEAKYLRGEQPLNKLTQEIELGLPYRLQLDYEAAGGNFESEEEPLDHWRYGSSSVELRWALARWDVIPLNPTVKAEWKFSNGQADAYELSLSLGSTLAPRWHWAGELFYEQQVGDDREREYSGSLALSYTLIDEKLGLGVEAKLTDMGDKGQTNPEWSAIVGPSLQWRPTRRTHVDVATLFGVTGRAPYVNTFVFFGIDFGPGSEPEEAIQGASLRNR